MEAFALIRHLNDDDTQHHGDSKEVVSVLHMKQPYAHGQPHQQLSAAVGDYTVHYSTSKSVTLFACFSAVSFKV